MTDKDRKLIALLQRLPEGFWDFKGNDTREYTHGIHSYPAMMVCPISRNIIKIMNEVMPISSLFDPFSGSGTVLVEGMLAGIPNILGNDINPLALFLAKAKTTLLDVNALQYSANELLSSIQNRYEQYMLQIDSVDDVLMNAYGLDLTAKSGWGDDGSHYLKEFCEKNKVNISIPDFKNIGYWFKPRAILLLQIIKEEINEIKDKNIRDFIFVAFSESIRLVSNRRNGEFKMFRMPPAKVEEFTPNVVKEFSTILQRNVKKMNSFVEACADTGTSSKVTIFHNNATILQDIANESVDLVITSPPYGDSRTTVAYGEYSRLSLQWLGIENLSEKEIMGIDRSLMGGAKFRNGFEYTIPSLSLRESLFKIKDIDLERAGDVYSFYSDLEKSIKAISEKTKTDGYHFWVVGNRTVKGELLKTDVIISEIADHYGLEHIYTIDRNIINKVMPSLNSPTNESGVKSGTMTNEHIVVLRKR